MGVSKKYSAKNPIPDPELIKFVHKYWKPKGISDGSDAFLGALYLQKPQEKKK